MTLNIADPEVERLARILAERTGETELVAIRRSVEERLHRVGSDAHKTALLEDMTASRRRWAALPVLDASQPNDVIGYDEDGLPQ